MKPKPNWLFREQLEKLPQLVQVKARERQVTTIDGLCGLILALFKEYEEDRTLWIEPRDVAAMQRFFDAYGEHYREGDSK